MRSQRLWYTKFNRVGTRKWTDHIGDIRFAIYTIWDAHRETSKPIIKKPFFFLISVREKRYYGKIYMKWNN